MRWAQNGVVEWVELRAVGTSGKRARQRHRVSRSTSSPVRVPVDYPMLV